VKLNKTHWTSFCPKIFKINTKVMRKVLTKTKIKWSLSVHSKVSLNLAGEFLSIYTIPCNQYLKRCALNSLFTSKQVQLNPKVTKVKQIQKGIAKLKELKIENSITMTLFGLTHIIHQINSVK